MTEKLTREMFDDENEDKNAGDAEDDYNDDDAGGVGD